MLYMKVQTMANTIFNARVATLVTIALVAHVWIKPPIIKGRRPPTITHGTNIAAWPNVDQNATYCAYMLFYCYNKKVIISNSTPQ